MNLSKTIAIATASLFALGTIHVATLSAQTSTEGGMVATASKKDGGKAKASGGKGKSCAEFKYFSKKDRKCVDARDGKKGG